MKIINSQVVFTFDRVLDIRKRVFEYEEYLKDEFQIPIKINPFPDEIDPNLPRLESTSKHNFSKLAIAQNRITLSTNYDNQYSENIDTIFDYLDKKGKIILPLISNFNKQFTAIIVELVWYFDKEEINKLLGELSALKLFKDKIKDFTLYYSKEYHDEYFINIKISKIEEEFLLKKDHSNELIPMGDIKYGISIIIDLNTRLSYNRNNIFKDELINSIKGLLYEIITKNNIENYVCGTI